MLEICRFAVCVIFVCLVSNVSGTSFYRKIKSIMEVPGPVKNYTGIRIEPNSLMQVFDHDQTIAITELSPSNYQLINCELLEVRTKRDRRAALAYLKSLLPMSRYVPLKAMLDIINDCRKIDLPEDILIPKQYIRNLQNQLFDSDTRSLTGFLSSTFSAILPGTRWCGHGDRAGSYYDLGHEKEIDKCCRAHDYCPEKIMSFSTKYNVTNLSYHTKSHCDCETEFYKCLKSVNSVSSELIGAYYFRSVSCLKDVPGAEGHKVLAQKDFEW